MVRRRPPSSPSERGATMLELAIVLPVLLAVLLSSLDLGIVFNQYVAAGEAAQGAAQAAAASLTGSPLVLAPAVGGPAQQAAQQELQRVAAIVPSAQLGLSWAGPPRTVQITYPPYTFTFQVPWSQNATSAVDWAHSDQVPYQEPVLGTTQNTQWQYTWVPYADSVTDTWWSYEQFPNSAWYPDSTGSVGYNVMSGPTGFGIVAWGPFGWGWGGGSGWVWGSQWNGQWLSQWDQWMMTDWQYPGTWAIQSSWPYDQWRWAATPWFSYPDTNTTVNGWQTWSAPTDTQGGNVVVGPYAQSAGAQQVQVQAPSAPQTITRRTLEAQVTITLRVLSPWLAPLLGGMTITRTGFANAQMAQ